MRDLFADATPVARGMMIEDALAIVLQRLGEITHDEWKNRCLELVVRRCEGEVESTLIPLWDLACELEARLS